jgi:hypothetical protein
MGNFISNLFLNRVKWTTNICQDLNLFQVYFRKLLGGDGLHALGPRPYPPPFKVRRGRGGLASDLKNGPDIVYIIPDPHEKHEETMKAQFTDKGQSGCVQDSLSPLIRPSQ